MRTSSRLPWHRRHAGETTTARITIGGIERTVEIPADTPRAPADFDRWRSNGSTTGTAVVVCGALGWSVAAIGDLLSHLAPAALAYTIAAVFDLAWILCMNYEYELRYQPKRQRTPRTVGWLLLAVSVGVIFLHGIRVADFWVALTGSVIAVLAKVLWHVRVHIGRRELSPAVQAWVDAELDDAAALLQVIGARRQAARAHARAVAELDALGLPAGTAVPDTPRAVLKAVPDSEGNEGSGGDSEDKLIKVARDMIGAGPVPSRPVLRDMLRQAGYKVGTDRAQKIVVALRDSRRDTGTGT